MHGKKALAEAGKLYAVAASSWPQQAVGRRDVEAAGAQVK
jgi:hypothetical protein